ncbi:hypothetical protein ACJIZ3_021453 [Penstemon smallii]|uniref:MATH domain-containing protein n=1 Tax=Penstemon smallii TaxID=265156 RepID=A0ABD3SLH2_9LAMI
MDLIKQNKDNDEVSVETRDAAPSHFLFKIENFSSSTPHHIHKYESTEFSAGEYKWRLIFNFNDGDNIAVNLAVSDTSSLPTRWEINAVFSIFLYNQKSNKFYSIRWRCVPLSGRARRFHALKQEWGFPKFISKKSLMDQSNGYLVNDNCVFGAEVFVINIQSAFECLSISKDGKPYEQCWKIPKFSQLGNEWVSEDFLTGDHKWYMKVYPRGNRDAKDHNISIYLYLVDSIRSPFRNVMTNFTFRIKDQKNGKHYITYYIKWFTRSGEAWGWSKFMSITDMNDPNKGFIVDDCCVLEVEILVQAVSHSLIT